MEILFSLAVGFVAGYFAGMYKERRDQSQSMSMVQTETIATNRIGESENTVTHRRIALSTGRQASENRQVVVGPSRVPSITM